MARLAGEHERQPIIIERFVLPDIDRSVLNTEAYLLLLTQSLVEAGVPGADAAESLQLLRASKGTSLSAPEFLRGIYGDEMTEVAMELLQSYEDNPNIRSSLLYGGATIRLFNALDAQQQPFGLMTYGERNTQQQKIDSIRRMTRRNKFNLRAEITKSTAKSESLARRAIEIDGEMLIPIPTTLTSSFTVARQVVILDDKKSNLRSSNTAILGIEINNEHPASGQISIDDLVTAIESGIDIAQLAKHFPPENDA